jgi:hypothetical protein
MPTNRRLYANAIGQVGDRLKEANALLGDAEQSMRAERPGEARAQLERAEMVISGAATLAKWATTLLKEESQ